jgi:hypothetical protein
MKPMHRFIAAAIVTSMVIAPATSVWAAQASAAAAAAAKASPALVDELASAMSATPEQAAGAAGVLFGAAKSNMKAADFSQVSKAVPGMASLLKAAPAAGGGAAGALSQLSGQAGVLAGAGAAFSKLGLSPELVSKAIPILTAFVTKSGGADVGKLLAAALK